MSPTLSQTPSPTTAKPATASPTTSPTTLPSATPTSPPVTAPPVTVSPVTESPVTELPATESPGTEPPTPTALETFSPSAPPQAKPPSCVPILKGAGPGTGYEKQAKLSRASSKLHTSTKGVMKAKVPNAGSKGSGKSKTLITAPKVPKRGTSSGIKGSGGYYGKMDKLDSSDGRRLMVGHTSTSPPTSFSTICPEDYILAETTTKRPSAYNQGYLKRRDSPGPKKESGW